MTVKSYRDLLVWQKGMDLAERCYRATEVFPHTETFGLSAQIRRAAASIPANIAEGHGRDHIAEYIHHLSIAKGSLMEVETHLLLSGRLGYIARPALSQLLEEASELGRMLAGLSAALKRRRAQRPKSPTPDP